MSDGHEHLWDHQGECEVCNTLMSDVIAALRAENDRLREQLEALLAAAKDAVKFRRQWEASFENTRLWKLAIPFELEEALDELAQVLAAARREAKP